MLKLQIVMNIFGDKWTFTSFGESHGAAIGGVLDGVPAGLHIDLQMVRTELERRAGKGQLGTSPRSKNEPDEVAFEQAEYSLAVGESLQPSVVFAENTASDALSFQSSDIDICRVNRSTGELTPKKKGTVTITVKTFNHIAATCKVVVK